MKYDFSQFSSNDNEYRLHLYNSVFKKKLIPQTLEEIFLFTFCSHQDFHELSKTFSINDTTFDAFKELIVQYIDKTGLVQYDTSDEIVNINKLQYNKLKNQNFTITYYDVPDSESEYNPVNQVRVLRDVEPSTTRDLCFYFRRESYDQHSVQMDYFQFVAHVYVAHWLMKNRYIRCFNNIKIVCREPNLYPKYVHHIVPTATVINVSGDKFIE